MCKEGARGPSTGLDTGDAAGAEEEPKNLSHASICKLLRTDSGGESQRTIGHGLVLSLPLPKELFLAKLANSPKHQPLLKSVVSIDLQIG